MKLPSVFLMYAQMPATCMPLPPFPVLAIAPEVMSPLLVHPASADCPPRVVPDICPTMPASITGVSAGSSPSNEIETLLATFSMTDSVANAATPAMAVPAEAVPRTMIRSPEPPTVRFRTEA